MTDDAYRQLMKHAHRLAMDGHGELAQFLRDAMTDAERFTYWFSNTPKPMSLADDYMKGVRERWNLNQWRAAIDAARKERT